MSERYFCGNCWQVSERGALLYRCTGCGDASLPEWMRGTDALRRVGDLLPWHRRLWAGDEGPPACPFHPKVRLHLFCPVCGQSIHEASRIRGKDPLALGVAGPMSAGKTLFTVNLIQQLRRRPVRGEPLGLMGLDTTEKRFAELADRLRRGQKPAKTETVQSLTVTETAPSNFCWQVLTAGPERRNSPPAFLAIYDVAGEVWGRPSDEARARFDRYVAALGSLVFLIDGAAVARDLGFEVNDAWDPQSGADASEWVDRQWLAETRNRLGRRSRKVDLALVVSKADHLWNRPGWEDLRPGAGNPAAHLEALRRLLRETGRNDLWAEAHQSFGRVQLFAASNLGFCPGPDDVSRDNGNRLVRPVTPVGVAEPVLWLLGLRLPYLQGESGP